MNFVVLAVSVLVSQLLLISVPAWADTSNATAANSAVVRAKSPEYRLAAGLHSLSSEQVEKINQAFDTAFQKNSSRAAARKEFFAAVRKVLSAQQQEELKKFHDPQANTSDLKIEHDVSYLATPDAIHVGDLYTPRNKKGTLPAVMFIHGGGWNAGSKEQSAHTAISLAKRGFVVYNINYRLVGHGGEFPADISDVKDAFAFFASKAKDWKIDPSHIAVMGGSAGAHLSMMLGYTNGKQFPAEHYPESNAKPAAIVSWFGPTDLNMDHVLIKKYLAKAGKEGPHDASPITYADTAIPTLFVHGTADKLVEISHSENMDKALKQRKIPEELVPIPGALHGFGGKDWDTAISKTVQFLQKQL